MEDALITGRTTPWSEESISLVEPTNDGRREDFEGVFPGSDVMVDAGLRCKRCRRHTGKAEALGRLLQGRGVYLDLCRCGNRQPQTTACPRCWGWLHKGRTEGGCRCDLSGPLPQTTDHAPLGAGDRVSIEYSESPPGSGVWVNVSAGEVSDVAAEETGIVFVEGDFEGGASLLVGPYADADIRIGEGGHLEWTYNHPDHLWESFYRDYDTVLKAGDEVVCADDPARRGRVVRIYDTVCAAYVDMYGEDYRFTWTFSELNWAHVPRADESPLKVGGKVRLGTTGVTGEITHISGCDVASVAWSDGIGCTHNIFDLRRA